MASATFGQRNAVKPAKALRPPQVAVPRRNEVELGRPEADLRPAHSVSVSASDPAQARKTLVGILALLLVAVIVPVVYLSDLRRDAGLKDTFRPDLGVQVERANCSRYFFLVTSCSVQLSWPEGNSRKTADGGFLVGLESMGGLAVIPLRSSADKDVVTSSVAIDHLGNRTKTMVILPGLCLLLSALMLRKLLAGRA